LFRTAAGKTGALTGNAMWQQDAYRMIQRLGRQHQDPDRQSHLSCDRYHRLPEKQGHA
jgi:hypothetical protein